MERPGEGSISDQMLVTAAQLREWGYAKYAQTFSGWFRSASGITYVGSRVNGGRGDAATYLHLPTNRLPALCAATRILDGRPYRASTDLRRVPHIWLGPDTYVRPSRGDTRVVFVEHGPRDDPLISAVLYHEHLTRLLSL